MTCFFVFMNIICLLSSVAVHDLDSMACCMPSSNTARLEMEKASFAGVQCEDAGELFLHRIVTGSSTIFLVSPCSS